MNRFGSAERHNVLLAALPITSHRFNSCNQGPLNKLVMPTRTNTQIPRLSASQVMAAKACAISLKPLRPNLRGWIHLHDCRTKGEEHICSFLREEGINLPVWNTLAILSKQHDPEVTGWHHCVDSMEQSALSCSTLQNHRSSQFKRNHPKRRQPARVWRVNGLAVSCPLQILRKAFPGIASTCCESAACAEVLQRL